MFKKGARFLLTSPIPAIALTHWHTPFTGGHEVSIPAGTIIVVNIDQVEGAAGVSCIPENYEELHAALVPEEDRRAEKYGGFSLSVLLADLRAHGQAV